MMNDDRDEQRNVAGFNVRKMNPQWPQPELPAVFQSTVFTWTLFIIIYLNCPMFHSFILVE